jgi:diguanylate cyclase (GGDEF)-like protein
MQIPLSLQSPEHVLKSTQAETLALGIYYGMVSVMVLYNLFVFFSVREVNYLYYVFYVISMLLFLASLNGITFQYLWPNSIWWNDQSIIFMLCSVVVFACLFTPRFLNLSTCRPKLNNLFTLLTIAGFMLTLASFLLPYNIMILITLVLAMIGISTAMIAAIVRFMDGYTPAKYYIYGWSFMLLGGAILAANKAGLVPRNLFTENTLQLGSAMEVVLLSLALADRLHVEKTERFEAQRQALEIQKQATELLEARVAERTSELEVVNRKLQELSTTDGLTNIGNRRFFDDMLDFEFARAQREQHFLTLMLIDIDNFKLLNDNYGHVIGDECLKIVAKKIKQQLHRETDIVARYGGEEFVVLLANTNQEASEKLANNIRTAMHTVKKLAGGIKPNLTVSLGVIVTIPSAQDSPQGLLKLADDALYRSKNNGRDQVSMA